MKYGTDPGAGNRCFLPETQAAIDVLKDFLQPLMLVEEEKKARKATKEGMWKVFSKTAWPPPSNTFPATAS